MHESGHVAVWFGRRREKAVLEMCEKHYSKVLSVVVEMKKFIDAYCNSDFDSARKVFEEIFRFEREADDVKKSIVTELMRGPFHPLDREEIMKLVLTVDDIAAYVKASSRRLLYVNPKEVPENIRDGLKTITYKMYDAATILKEGLSKLTSKPDDALDAAEKTERIEEEVDDLRVDLIAEILKWGDKVESIGSWLMIKDAVEFIENAVDRLEDTADVIRAIVILSI
jgi:predicted phosphate transport protein (TIGR00153 family)